MGNTLSAGIKFGIILHHGDIESENRHKLINIIEEDFELDKGEILDNGDIEKYVEDKWLSFKKFDKNNDKRNRYEFLNESQFPVEFDYTSWGDDTLGYVLSLKDIGIDTDDGLATSFDPDDLALVINKEFVEFCNYLKINVQEFSWFVYGLYW